MKEKEEYYFLIEKLEEINWELDGQCNDIDCNKYAYRDLLKRKYEPVLEHNFSCIGKLKKEKNVVLRLLSQNKYKKYRFDVCRVCKKTLDKLNDENRVVGFTKPIKQNGKIYYEWNGVWVHKKCKSKVKTPVG